MRASIRRKNQRAAGWWKGGVTGSTLTLLVVVGLPGVATAQVLAPGARPGAAGPPTAPGRPVPQAQGAQPQRSQSGGAPAEWIAELPAPNVVRAAIRGADAKDTVMRQLAAFEVLKDALRALTPGYSDFTGYQNMDPAAVAQDVAYSRAMNEVASMAPAADRQHIWFEHDNLSTSAEFRRMVVAKFFSKRTREAYEKTDSFQRVLEVDTRDVRAAARKEAEQAQAAKENARVAAVTHSLDEDRRRSKGKAGIMSAFGVIEIGETLDLPQCGMGGRDETCIEEPSSELFRTEEAPPPGVTRVRIRLASNRCPEWIGCVVRVLEFSNHVLGVEFESRENTPTDDVVGALTQKYGRPNGGKGAVRECRNSVGVVVYRAADRLWRLPGVTVWFDPVWESGAVALRNAFVNRSIAGSLGSVSCRQGHVEIVTSTYLRLRDEGVKRQHENQPKL